MTTETETQTGELFVCIAIEQTGTERKRDYFRLNTESIDVAVRWALAKLMELTGRKYVNDQVDRMTGQHDGGLQVKVMDGDLLHLIDIEDEDAIASAMAYMDDDLASHYQKVEVGHA